MESFDDFPLADGGGGTALADPPRQAVERFDDFPLAQPAQSQQPTGAMGDWANALGMTNGMNPQQQVAPPTLNDQPTAPQPWMTQISAQQQPPSPQQTPSDPSMQAFRQLSGQIAGQQATQSTTPSLDQFQPGDYGAAYLDAYRSNQALHRRGAGGEVGGPGEDRRFPCRGRGAEAGRVRGADGEGSGRALGDPHGRGEVRHPSKVAGDGWARPPHRQDRRTVEGRRSARRRTLHQATGGGVC